MKKVHLICNAHIDPIWQWDWQEGVSAAISTFASAVALADEYDYIFCHNEVTLYKYIEEYSPELFEKIKRLVLAGKWRIMGGWYLQPDCNMPSGESFVRQILKGKEYFIEKFGVFPTVAVNVDPFGHTRGLVQIIKKCGQDGYLFMRPYPGELQLPSEQFVWQGFAGCEIKANRAESYNTPLGYAAQAIKERTAHQPQDVICVLWGVGNHGGGPSRKDLSDIAELMKEGNAEYVHSSPEQFFAEMRAEAKFDKSLHISMPGCYTSMGRVKRAHIVLENELYRAEKLCSIAALKGLIDYPKEKFDEATEDLLNAEFHDTLPGSCIASGEKNALEYLHHGLLDAEKLKTKAFFALLGEKKKASDGEYPVFVANSEPYDIEENVECEFILADQNWDENVISEISVYDEKGEKVAFQQIKEESTLNLDWRKRIAFKAKVKAASVARYSVFVEKQPKKGEKREETFIYKDERKFVEIDKNTGYLVRYEVDGREYINGELKLVMFDDNADPWAMGAGQLKRIGENEQPFETEKEPRAQFKGLKNVQIIENGEIFLGIEAFFVKDDTRARVYYKIYKNDAAIDIDVTLFMNDVNKIVKLEVPFSVSGKVVGQTAFGEDELFTDGRENVFHRYVAVKNGSESFAVINNCIYGGSVEDGAFYLNLARGVTYCAHPIKDRQLIPTDRYIKKIDQGQNDYSFRICAVDEDKIGRIAKIFNQKPYVLNAFPVSAEEQQSHMRIRLGNEAITLEALKQKADETGCFVLRLFNNAETSQNTDFSVNESALKLVFKGYEVKTVVLKSGKLSEIPYLII